MIQASGVVSARVWRTLLYVLFTSFSFESLDTVTSERSWRVNTSAEVFTRWPKTWNKLLGATWEYFNSSFQQKRFSQRIHTSSYWTLYLMNLQKWWRKQMFLLSWHSLTSVSQLMPVLPGGQSQTRLPSTGDVSQPWHGSIWQASSRWHRKPLKCFKEYQIRFINFVEHRGFDLIHNTSWEKPVLPFVRSPLLLLVGCHSTTCFDSHPKTVWARWCNSTLVKYLNFNSILSQWMP